MIEPVAHRLVVKPFDVADHDEAFIRAKAANIVIPDGNERKREQAAVDRGTIVAIGPTVFQDFNAPLTLVVGDDIVYAKYAGKEVEDPDTKEKLTIINDEDVVAILRKGKN